MTRGIFDPTGDTERSGSRFTGPDAQQDSHLPEPEQEAVGDEDEETVGFDGEGDAVAEIPSQENGAAPEK